MYKTASSRCCCQLSRDGPSRALRMLSRYCISKMAKLTNSKKAAVANALNRDSTTNPAHAVQCQVSTLYCLSSIETRGCNQVRIASHWLQAMLTIKMVCWAVIRVAIQQQHASILQLRVQGTQLHKTSCTDNKSRCKGAECAASSLPEHNMCNVY